ncbi:MAG: hypothetical protein ACRC92_26940 [Peptostreptococcaceae bacterium]
MLLFHNREENIVAKGEMSTEFVKKIRSDFESAESMGAVTEFWNNIKSNMNYDEETEHYKKYSIVCAVGCELRDMSIVEVGEVNGHDREESRIDLRRMTTVSYTVPDDIEVSKEINDSMFEYNELGERLDNMDEFSDVLSLHVFSKNRMVKMSLEEYSRGDSFGANTSIEECLLGTRKHR